MVLTRGREGVQKPENLADVICTCPPMRYEYAAQGMIIGLLRFLKLSLRNQRRGS